MYGLLDHVGKKGAELEMSIRIFYNILSRDIKLGMAVKLKYTITQGRPHFPTRFESFLIVFSVH